MKKRLTWILIAAMLLGILSGCGAAAGSQQASDAAASQTEASASQAEVPAPADTAAAAEEAPAEDAASAEETISAEEPAVEYAEISYPVFEELTDMTIFGSASAQFLGSVDMGLYAQTESADQCNRILSYHYSRGG